VPRANGMTQGSMALSQLVAPLLAGFLLGVIRFDGVVLVDFATFFLALGTLLATPIPAPKASEEAEKKSLLAGAADGWAYLRARSGLINLLVYFAAANFLVGIVSVLATPLVLSFASPAALGTVLSVGGLGMVVGSLVTSTWRGQKSRAGGIPLPLLSCGLFLALCGLRPSLPLVATGAFLFFCAVPLVNTAIRSTFHVKVPKDLHGRVFALVQMIAGSVSPLAFVLAGPLADRVFEPLLAPAAPWRHRSAVSSESAKAGASGCCSSSPACCWCFWRSGVWSIPACAGSMKRSPTWKIPPWRPERTALRPSTTPPETP